MGKRDFFENNNNVPGPGFYTDDNLQMKHFSSVRKSNSLISNLEKGKKPGLDKIILTSMNNPMRAQQEYLTSKNNSNSVQSLVPVSKQKP